MKIDPKLPREESIWGPHILWPPDRNFTGVFAGYTDAFDALAAELLKLYGTQPGNPQPPPVIKLVADDQNILYLDEFIKLNPRVLEETILIVRPIKLTDMAAAMVNAAGGEHMRTDVIAAANWLHKAILNLRLTFPRLAQLPIYWESINEPTPEMMDKAAIFDSETADLAHQDGIRRVLGLFPVGTPHIYDFPPPGEAPKDDWPKYYPVFEKIDEYGPDELIFGPHEYLMDVDKVPDKSTDRNELLLQPWTVGRINKVYEGHILPYGWDIAAVITEGPIHHPNKPGITDEMKLAWMTDHEFEQFYVNQVKGVCVFTIDGDENWRKKGFSFVPIAKRLFNHVTTYKPPAIIEVPPEEPEEPEEPPSEIAITTVHPAGQWIREKPSLAAKTVGDMDFGQIGYVSQEDASSIGLAYSWILVKTAWCVGYMAAWLLIRKD